MPKWRKILFGGVRVGIGIGLVAYLGASGAIEWKALGRLLSSWRLMALALPALLLDALLIAWRLDVLLTPRGFRIPLWPAFRLTMIGIFFNSCLPGATGGDLVKMYYAAEGHPGRRTEVATIILLDRATGMFALMLMPLLIAPLFPELTAASAGVRAVLWLAGGLCALMVLGTLLCWWEPFVQSRLVQAFIRLPKLGKHLGMVFETVHSYRTAPVAIAAAVGISLVAHVTAVAVAMISSLAAHPEEFTWQISVLIPLGFTANALPFTPGGLGVGEAAFNKMFALAGLSGGAEALLGWRLLTILVGLLGLVFYIHGRKRFLLDKGASEASEAVP
jgi:hypothetical protein